MSGDADTLRRAAAALAQERAAASPPWPIVSECYYPAAGLVAQGHTCPQCDGSHDHDWVGWRQGEYPFDGWSVTGQAGGPGIPVRCRVCGGRKCDMAECLLRRHHGGPHEHY